MTDKATLFVGDGGWGIYFGDWKDNIILDNGFDTAFDAWAFCFAHTMIDAAPNQVSREWTNKPQKRKPKQLKMKL